MIRREDIRDGIYNAALRREDGDWRRPHLGASQIGHECVRKAWLTLRWAKKPEIDGRVFRLFRRGHNEEKEFIDDLGVAGFTCYSDDEGEQFTFSALNGHYGGSVDAILQQPDEQWYIGEFKTYNKSRFNALSKEGVQNSDPVYYTQLQTYMGLSGFKQSLFFAVCKDNDHVHVEEIKYDEESYLENLEKARYIIQEDSNAPAPVSFNPSYYLCKWCDYYEICHKKDFSRVEYHCRTCRHSQASFNPEEKGQWLCNLTADPVTKNLSEQKEGCAKYQNLLPIVLG